VPEDEAVPSGLSPRQLCTYVAELHGIGDRSIVEWALHTVEMVPAADRSMDGFSKGMRQRSKVAAALVKNPLVLVLDEPLNGADPIQRLRLIELFRRLGAEGRTVIVSSHVLNEVEAMAERVIVVVRGRLAAAGGQRAIRDAMDDVPRRVLVRAPNGRRLAAALLGNDAVAGVSVDGDDILVSTVRAKDLAVILPRAARDLGIHLTEVRPLDDSLESLFRELVR
jgi:ABC-2 type transport system ATP-binding protein